MYDFHSSLERRVKPAQKPKKNLIATILIIIFITIYFFEKVTVLVISSMIIHEEPRFYKDGWMPKTICITSLVLSCIIVLTIIIIIIFFPILRGGNSGESVTSGVSIETLAEIFTLVVTYISWDVMWKHELGKVFCILVGIVVPSSWFLFVIISIVIVCVLSSGEQYY